MHVEKISAEQAHKLHMRPGTRYGIVSEGCSSVWGDGDTAASALCSAVINHNRQAEFGSRLRGRDFIPPGSWVVEVTP